jgi:GNAT superfamily N-acetyltransferase
MQQELTIRKAIPGDDRVAAALLRQTLRPEVRKMTIWESARIDHYVKALLETCGGSPANEIYLLHKGQKIIGAILLCITGGQMFTQAIFVDPVERGAGYGNLLYSGAIEACSKEHPELNEIGWDVFEGHDQLETWYTRLGGIETDRRGWWLADQSALCAIDGVVPYECRGLAAADRNHAEQGFSSFEIQAGESTIEVGRLPGPYFRVLSRVAIDDPRFLFTLSRLDAERSVLHIGEPAGLADPWRLHYIMRRLRFEPEALIQAFRARNAASSRRELVEVI